MMHGLETVDLKIYGASLASGATHEFHSQPKVSYLGLRAR